jgi:hypothetical protein
VPTPERAQRAPPAPAVSLKVVPPVPAARSTLASGSKRDAQERTQAARESARKPSRTAVAKARTEVREPPRTGPARTAAAVPASTGAPRSACGALSKYALLQCMQRQCNHSSWRKHPQCQRLINQNVLSS